MSIKISIANPCHENWEKMLPENQGKFCLSCQKNVIDFTEKTDAEILTFFSNYSSNTCGRFANEQLNRPITKPRNHSIGNWKYFWQILIPAMFAVNKVNAQNNIGKSLANTKVEAIAPQYETLGYVSQSISPHNYLLIGKVVDDAGNPIPFCSISAQKNIIHSTICDTLGNFKLHVTLSDSLEFSAIGFISKKIVVDFKHDYPITISLQKKFEKLQDVVVTGYETTKRRYFTGGDISIINSKRINKASIIKFFTPTKDSISTSLKIFPNPIVPGQSFTIELKNTKPEEYQLKIVDALGRIIQQKTVLTNSKKYAETLDGSAFKVSGIYMVSLINIQNKPVLTGKILVK